VRFSIVIQKILPLTMQRLAIKFTRRSAIHSLACSALQPDFMIFCKVTIFYLRAYQLSFLQVAYGSR
jgi:hypothetical protein